MLLHMDGQQIEGPAADVYQLLFTSLVNTLRGNSIRQDEAERIGMQALVRIESRLAGAGYIVRHLDSTEETNHGQETPPSQDTAAHRG